MQVHQLLNTTSARPDESPLRTPFSVTTGSQKPPNGKGAPFREQGKPKWVNKGSAPNSAQPAEGGGKGNLKADRVADWPKRCSSGWE